MGLVYHDPVRSSGLGAKLEKPWKKRGEELWALRERDAQQVHDDVSPRRAQHVQRLGDRRRSRLIAEDDRPVDLGEVAFRIDHADLIAALGDLLEDSRRERRLSASRRAGDENPGAVRLELQRLARLRLAERNEMA